MQKTIDPSSAGSRALRIFLVEDSPAVRDLLIANLSEIPGIVFAGCSDSESNALEQLTTQWFDVLILDITLKQGNGISLLRTLAHSETHSDNLKIIFSNNVSSAYRRAGEQYGVRFFFDKASDFPQLRSLLEKLAADAIPH